jgi:hypothetical protein
MENRIGHKLYKLKLYNFLKIKNKKINQIPMEQKKFPIFAKPRTGYASVGAFKIKNKTDLNKLLLNINPKNYIFQKFLTGKEYTVDVYINNHGIVEGIVARERVRVLHGESIFIKTFQIKKINLEVIFCGWVIIWHTTNSFLSTGWYTMQIHSGVMLDQSIVVDAAGWYMLE